jgi:hypothetical protein
VDQTELERVREQFGRAVRTRLPDVPVERVEVLQHGEDPEVEPGQLLARVVFAVPGGDRQERERAFKTMHDERREAFRELRRELNELAVPVMLQFVADGERAQEQPRLMLKLGQTRGPLGVIDAPGLTPVMARLGPDDLQTLDTLIKAGIAGSRAEAVRWALARIRERPAYEQLRARTREIEDLKAQF